MVMGPCWKHVSTGNGIVFDSLFFRVSIYNREKSKARADLYRSRVAQIKIDSGCVDCGYNTDPRALEFDHLPGVEKTMTVAAMMYHGWNRILEEIAKCEVVCANCHAIRTMSRRGL